MRHKNHRTKLGRNSSHRLAMFRNMAKSFIISEKIETTVEKAKELKKVVEPLITLAKVDSMQNRRRVEELLGLHYNALTPKELKEIREGNLSSYNDDRKVVNRLFLEVAPKFKERQGGYTRIVRTGNRVGDSAEVCLLESVE